MSFGQQRQAADFCPTSLAGLQVPHDRVVGRDDRAGEVNAELADIGAFTRPGIMQGGLGRPAWRREAARPRGSADSRDVFADVMASVKSLSGFYRRG